MDLIRAAVVWAALICYWLTMFLPLEGEAGGGDGWKTTKLAQQKKISDS